MSGHSKWHKIRHKKSANDAARGKVLTKHSKIIAVVGRTDPNPETNASLRSVIANAKADGVPKDNIDKILKKIAGEGKDGAVYHEVVYEGFGPGGIPVMIEALTDNVNRTFPEVRTAFEKNGGNLGSTGTVSFMFDRVGVITVKTGGKSEDALMDMAIEAGAQDLEYDEEVSEMITDFKDLAAVRTALEGQSEILKSEPRYMAKDPQAINDPVIIGKFEKFLEAVEAVEDIDEVYVGSDIIDQ
ncbi:MAG TPA: YebC/PmpR family DNA-binding transcriptional regulator [Candidatus Gracilibacteria bacterium]